MIIGIDIDNTLVNTAETVIEYVNERLPVDIKLSDIKQYWMENALPENFRWIVPSAFKDSSMWKNVKMIDGACEVVKKLYNDGNEIYFVTSALPENTRKKINHLSRNLNFLSRDFIQERMININKKQLLSLDILIDDFMDNLTGYRSYYSICLAYPWNYQIHNDKFFRVNSWDEVYDICCKLKGVITNEKK